MWRHEKQICSCKVKNVDNKNLYYCLILHQEMIDALSFIVLKASETWSMYERVS